MYTWNQFQTKHAGMGYTKKQLSKMYAAYNKKWARVTARADEIKQTKRYKEFRRMDLNAKPSEKMHMNTARADDFGNYGLQDCSVYSNGTNQAVGGAVVGGLGGALVGGIAGGGGGALIGTLVGAGVGGTVGYVAGSNKRRDCEENNRRIMAQRQASQQRVYRY